MKKLKIIGICLTLLFIVGCTEYPKKDSIYCNECVDSCGIDYLIVECKEQEPTENWVVKKDEIRDYSMTLNSWEYARYDMIEEHDISFDIPDRYKMEVNNITINSVKEPYPCIFNCPTNSSLNGCEYGTCYRPYDGDCIKIDSTNREIESNCDIKLIVNLRYRYTQWKLHP